MRIKIKCPDCGESFTIDVPLLDKLQNELDILRKKVYDDKDAQDGANMFSQLFGGFKK